MRCFFLRNGHIAAVEMLPGLSTKKRSPRLISYFFWSAMASLKVSRSGIAPAWSSGILILTPRSRSLRQPQDDVAVALARAADCPEPVDAALIKPNIAITVGRAISSTPTLDGRVAAIASKAAAEIVMRIIVGNRRCQAGRQGAPQGFCHDRFRTGYREGVKFATDFLRAVAIAAASESSPEGVAPFLAETLKSVAKAIEFR